MKKLLIIALILISTFAKATIKVTITNTATIDRTGEIVEVPWNEILTKLPDANARNIVVVNDRGDQVPSQVTSQNLLFQVMIGAKSSIRYTIRTSRSTIKFHWRTFGRLVPERMDDWAWENERIAFRVYGPALEATGEISNGIDVWLKCTPELVINKWYMPGVNYHRDSGEGLDNYKVGRTLGAGGFAPLNGEKLALGRNFVKAELLDSGAIRTTVRLTYAPFKVEDKTVNEVRVISLDASTNMNRITETFTGDFDSLPGVAAIVLRNGGQIEKFDQGVAYIEDQDQTNGTTYLAVVMPDKSTIKNIENHIAASATIYNGQSLTYLSGAGWSKWGFPTTEHWISYVAKEIVKLNNPLKVTLK